MKIEEIKNEPVFNRISITIESRDELNALTSLFFHNGVAAAMNEAADSNFGTTLCQGLDEVGGKSNKYMVVTKHISFAVRSA